MLLLGLSFPIWEMACGMTLTLPVGILPASLLIPMILYPFCRCTPWCSDTFLKMTYLPQSSFNYKIFTVLKKIEFRNHRAHIHPLQGFIGWVGGWGVDNPAWLEYSIWMWGDFRAEGQMVPLEEAFV